MEKCEKCSSTDLFQMGLAVSGEPAHFAHCRVCEHRWWTLDADTRALDLREVLAS